MTRIETLEAIRCLRDGRDPVTGETLPSHHICQRADIVRALFAAVEAMERDHPSFPCAGDDDLDPPDVPAPAFRSRPPNAGRPWSGEEDRRLIEAFEGGGTDRELAAAFGRSRNGIRARLVHLGRGALLGDGPGRRYPLPGADAGAAEPGISDVGLSDVGALG